MIYILQDRNFALGNFINLTPAIRCLSERQGQRIPVFFETAYVRDCFLDCPFIKILNGRPEQLPSFTSATINNANDRPDYQFAFEVMTGRKWTPEYHTYVDFCSDAEEIEGIMLLNGSGSANQDYIAKKDVGQGPYLAVKKYAGREKIFSGGSLHDLDRAPYMATIADEACWGDIRQTLKTMARAKCVIANDTGLAHAAGAMNKPLLVLWKDTPRERCKNAGHRTEYSYENHEENIEAFLKKYLH